MRKIYGITLVIAIMVAIVIGGIAYYTTIGATEELTAVSTAEPIAEPTAAPTDEAPTAEPTVAPFVDIDVPTDANYSGTKRYFGTVEAALENADIQSRIDLAVISGLKVYDIVREGGDEVVVDANGNEVNVVYGITQLPEKVSFHRNSFKLLLWSDELQVNNFEGTLKGAADSKFEAKVFCPEHKAIKSSEHVAYVAASSTEGDFVVDLLGQHIFDSMVLVKRTVDDRVMYTWCIRTCGCAEAEEVVTTTSSGGSGSGSSSGNGGGHKKAEPTAAPTAEPTAEPTATPKATGDNNPRPTAAPTAKATATPKATGDNNPRPTAAPTAKATAKVSGDNNSRPEAAPTAKATATATAESSSGSRPTMRPAQEETEEMPPKVNDEF